MIEVELLPALYGDAIWIRYGKTRDALHHVLVDTGFEDTAAGIVKRLREDAAIRLELFVMTHIDEDHIKGSIFLLQDKAIAKPSRIQDVWFNGWPQIDSVAKDALGALQGEYFSALIRKRGLPWNKAFNGKPVAVKSSGALPEVVLEGGMKLTLLSPSVKNLKTLRGRWLKDLKGQLKPGDEKAALELLADDKRYASDALGDTMNVGKLAGMAFSQDSSVTNGSSIAFLADYDGSRMLFTGDAHPETLVKALERLGPGGMMNVDLLKVSHHGSRYNTSPELLERIRCKHALISTNGQKFKHPEAECMARLIAAHKGKDFTVHFNYASDRTKPWREPGLKNQYGYKTEYGTNGSLILSL